MAAYLLRKCHFWKRVSSENNSVFPISFALYIYIWVLEYGSVIEPELCATWHTKVQLAQLCLFSVRSVSESGFKLQRLARLGLKLNRKSAKIWVNTWNWLRSSVTRKEFLLTIRVRRIENMVSWHESLSMLYLFVFLYFSDEQTKGIAGSIWWGLSAFSLTVLPSHLPYGRY